MLFEEAPMVETYKAEYSYYRAGEGLHESILPDSEEFSLLEEHWNADSDGNYLCIAQDEYGVPQAYTFEASPFLKVGNLPKHPATEGACYFRGRDYKTYRNFLVSNNNAILPEGSSLSKFWDRATGDRITHIADTNENGVPDSGDTGYTRWGERVDDILLTSPLIDYDEVGPVFGHVINAVPKSDDGSLYDVRHFDSNSGEALAVEVGKSSTEYIEKQYESAREMGAAISDNPVVAVGIAAGIIVASAIHPYVRAALTGLAYLGSIGGALYIVSDRVMGAYNYAAGKTKDVIMGAHDFDAFLWMAGSTAFGKMKIKEAIQAPVKVLEAYNATMVGGLRILLSRGGGGMGGYMYSRMTPALVTSGGGLALDAEVAVAAATFPKIPGLANLFPAAMAMSTEAAVTIGTKGKPKVIDTENFPPRGKEADWNMGKAGKAEERVNKLLDDAAEFYLDEAIESTSTFVPESIGDQMGVAARARAKAAQARFDGAMANIDSSKEMLGRLKEIHRHAPDELRSFIEGGLESIGRDIEKVAWEMSPQARARFAETELSRLRSFVNDAIDTAEGTGKTVKGGEMIFFLTDKVKKVKDTLYKILVPKKMDIRKCTVKEAKKIGMPKDRLQEAMDIIHKRKDANGNVGKSIRPSLKEDSRVGEVIFDDGPGYRVYYTQRVGDGRAHILKLGIKKNQDANIGAASRKVDELIDLFNAGEDIYKPGELYTNSK